MRSVSKGKSRAGVRQKREEGEGGTVDRKEKKSEGRESTPQCDGQKQETRCVHDGPYESIDMCIYIYGTHSYDSYHLILIPTHYLRYPHTHTLSSCADRWCGAHTAPPHPQSIHSHRHPDAPSRRCTGPPASPSGGTCVATGWGMSGINRCA